MSVFLKPMNAGFKRAEKAVAAGAETDFEIRVGWESYGYAATCPQTGETFGHAAGPTQAAEELASVMKGGPYLVKRIRRGYFVLSRKN